MKKRVVRLIALILVFLLMLSNVAFAAMNASEYINVASAWITLDGNTVKVHFCVIGTDTMDQIGVKYIYLYEKNGITWSLKQIFNYTDPLYSAAMMDANTTLHSGNVSYLGSATNEYYASCWSYAEKNGGSDMVQHNAY